MTGVSQLIMVKNIDHVKTKTLLLAGDSAPFYGFAGEGLGVRI
jgi:hypothetical protein